MTVVGLVLMTCGFVACFWWQGLSPWPTLALATLFSYSGACLAAGR